MSDGAVFSTRTDREEGFDLRSLRLGGEELISRLYFAVRDPLWRTIPMVARERRRTESPDGFEVEIHAATADPALPMEVYLRYHAQGDELVAQFVATALAPFDYCRIGFCLVLADEAYRGSTASSWHGEVRTDFAFPVQILARDQRDAASLAFHRPFDRLEILHRSGSSARVTVEGDLYELEDQRNWSDASYKAYSVSDGWPFHAQGAQRFSQRVVIRGSVSGATPDREPAHRRVRVDSPIGALCSIDLYRGSLSPRSFRPGGGFQELNARGPTLPDRYDSVELAVNGAVHAADSESVAGTTALHGQLVRQARTLLPGLPVILAPVSFLPDAGDWRDLDGSYVPEPPAERLDPRLLEEFGASWVIASVAAAAPEHPDALRYFAATLDPSSPAAETIARFRGLEGATLLASEAPPPIATIALVGEDAIVLALANRCPDEVSVDLPDGRRLVLPGFGSVWTELALPAADPAGSRVSILP